jgi:Sec-independent protein translocase protein TatA
VTGITSSSTIPQRGTGKIARIVGRVLGEFKKALNDVSFTMNEDVHVKKQHLAKPEAEKTENESKG